jgi:hypothetical protein
MKIGNIKQIVSSIAEHWKTVKVGEKEETFDLQRKIQKLPKENLEDWFQKRYNKNLDYDQWVGIRDELDSMGRRLYGSTLAIIGDAIMLIQAENEDKIARQEGELKEKEKEIEKLKVELKKYID